MGRALLAAGLALSPAMALAQQAPPASRPPDSIGPKALQDFSLSGTVTRPADKPVAEQVPPLARQPRAEAQAVQQPAAKAATRTAAAAPAPKRVQAAVAEPRLPKPEAAAPSDPAPLPQVTSVPATGGVAAVPAAPPSLVPSPQASGALASGHSFPMLAWLLEALVLVLAGVFLFWRTRGRHAFAGSAQFDLFTAPEPSPEPLPPPAPAARPAPVPAPAAAATPKAATPATTGVVSTRLRPWIEIGFQPIRSVLEDHRVMVEFELELFNSGNAPARAVLVEARLFNAGPDQDAQIDDFMANPVAVGERIPVIPPLKRLTVRSQALAPRDQILAYELAGHPVFVPLIGFNALYSWSGGEGQTSVSHLIGRDAKGAKLAPFRLDLGPHIFRNLAARPLPTGVRR